MITHTYATLEISLQAWSEIQAKLRDAGYSHLFRKEDGQELIDMKGIALAIGPAAGASCQGDIDGKTWHPIGFDGLAREGQVCGSTYNVRPVHFKIEGSDNYLKVHCFLCAPCRENRRGTFKPLEDDTVTIIVNGKDHVITGSTITYAALAKLVYPNRESPTPTITYYQKKTNAAGMLNLGDTIQLSNGLSFTVVYTNNA